MRLILKTKKFHLGSREIISGVVSVFFVVAIWLEWPRLLRSLALLSSRADWRLLLAVPLVLVSVLAAASAYRLLALRPLRLRELYVVELAAGAVNRVLPSGVGGMGVHGAYLHARQHTVTQAATVASINNLLGSAVHMTLLLALLLLDRSITRHFHLGLSKYMGWALLGIVLALVMLSVFQSARRRLKRVLAEIGATLAQYRSRPGSLAKAALSLAGVTGSNLMIFILAVSCLGMSFGVGMLFIIYTVGVALGASVPTPGGLGGVEAGLLTGLMAAGANSDAALAAVLVFRFATFWIPLFIGFPALLHIRSHKYI